MVYYKIPFTDNCLNYPAGCILCCGYHMGGYYYCKFEAVPDDGPGWVKITEEEFEANCPDFSVDLPTTGGALPAPDSAEVGQYVRISEVDENGAPTASEAVGADLLAADVSESMPTASAIDLSNFENGSFVETVDGSDVSHAVTFDEQGRPSQIGDIVITWG